MILKWAGLSVGLLLLVLSACGNEDALTAKEVKADAANDQEETETALETDVFEDIRQQSYEYMQEPDFNIITAKELYEKVIFEDSTEFLILDVRDTSTFAQGHIPGAVNIPYRISGKENMLDQLPEDKTIYVVCFSGHTASQTAGTLNLLGYEAKTLQFGMGGYAAGTELGASIPGAPAELEVVTHSSDTEGSYELPEVTYMDDLTISEIVMNQAQNYLDKDMPAVIGVSDVKEMVEKEEFEDYQLVDIRLEDDYKRGHVPHAINIPYTDLFESDQLKLLDPEKTTVLIGYNGYDASQVNRLLNQLEIPAVPMAYGMSMWAGDEGIIGQTPLNFDGTETLPVEELKYDLDGGEVETSCS
ncbi:respiratory selenite reductase-associated lipoprotein SrrE [Salipaludibacillus sp. CUR1]|uniref:respiratory selenite reductase-associated lipoprotein SrrE n=1 Tax=Salipaludibacillus sp. CUR1 TaxID=2820003 RepID=UPI001E51C31C|nr:respiratory selenite reductase-associated lipoprotein SrrE [Salipaludibacillus sp. CUR1]MCE7791580.1 respiratory selenite reductase-associated lipoprotein SrrE [Salipaludibacillus sp. CUR1]